MSDSFKIAEYNETAAAIAVLREKYCTVFDVTTTKGMDEAKKARSAAIQEATKGAALVPFKVGQKANELFALAETVITKGNQNAITDGAVAAMNARAAVRGAFLNVKINLGSIKDALFVEDLKKRMAEIEADVDAREQALLGKVKL